MSLFAFSLHFRYNIFDALECMSWVLDKIHRPCLMQVAAEMSDYNCQKLKIEIKMAHFLCKGIVMHFSSERKPIIYLLRN